jgi:hypothetical protein
MLAVQIDQVRSGVAELRERRWPAVDPRAAAALRVERSTQQERPVVAQVLLAEPGTKPRRYGDVELGGDLRALTAGAQLACLEAAAEQERQRVEQDRLARAGFARQYRKAGLEFDLEGVDNGEVANRQEMQHE